MRASITQPPPGSPFPSHIIAGNHRLQLANRVLDFSMSAF
jgi:hypothetical protein